MRIKVTVTKASLLKAYEATMSEYTAIDRSRYMQYAYDDIGGWLGDTLLWLIGVSSSGAVLHNVKEFGYLVTLDYEYNV